MDRKMPKNESSLLLQLPNNVLSFSDMSGNSFLLPVAADNVAETENNVSHFSSSEKREERTNVSEPTSVCQLQQPLMMRRGSSPGPKMSVPYSQSVAQTTNNDSGQTGMSYSGPHVQPTSNIQDLQQASEMTAWSNSASGQPLQSSAVFRGFQNQPNSSLSKPFSQENVNLSYQTNFPTNPSIPTSDYSSNANPSYPSFQENASNYQNATSAADYFSQPPVITPTNASTLYDQSGIIMSQPRHPQQSFTGHGEPLTSYKELYNRIYEPVTPYWLYKDIVENKEVWHGFSHEDSVRLETTFQQDPQAVVPVDGGRYDAILAERKKKPVYFDAKDLEIRRCTWFFRPGTSQRFIPFTEETSNLLEQHYSSCVTSGQWPKRIDIHSVGSVVLENPELFLFYKYEVEIWPSLPDSKASPKAVKRGLPENTEIKPSENKRIDHLVFIVQGIGSVCDLKFRTVTECVDGFRDIANKLLASHFSREIQSGLVGRVEFLPVAWHAKLHTSDQGFDRCMQNITLPSIPKLRHFTNDTLLDILLYSSPVYCQAIINTVTSELNKMYETFLKRNPEFSGKVFVAGHSLGSLILFDILCNQKVDDSQGLNIHELSVEVLKSAVDNDERGGSSEGNITNTYDILPLLQASNLEESEELFKKEKIDLSSGVNLTNDDPKDIGIPTGPHKKLLNTLHSKEESPSQGNADASEFPTGLPPSNQGICEMPAESESVIFPFKTSPCNSSIEYPKIKFEPACFFALGSPIAMFLTVRGYDMISEDFKFPTCPNFFHIFHPYDPVAFRIEPLIDPNFSVKPVLIPHHKGRKRMHLEIRENLSKVGFEIKQKVLETLRSTWNSLSGFARAHTFPSAAVEAEVDRLVTEQMSGSDYEQQATSETTGEEIQIGALNGGRRIDFVLQEKPIEALNDYIFALTSHATYWNSEDTVLMILREIYATQGIMVSSQSVLENKQFPQAEHLASAPHPYGQLSSVLSNPSLYESTQLGQAATSAASFYNQSAPLVPPPSSQSLQSFSATVPQVPSNVPPSTSTVQQPVGPPPLTGFVKRSPFGR